MSVVRLASGEPTTPALAIPNENGIHQTYEPTNSLKAPLYLTYTVIVA